ncbi:MAG: DMT family transporter [Pseudomonadota bacterium]
MSSTEARLVDGGKGATVRLLIGAVLISFSAVFVKLTSVSPTASAVYRCAFGGAVLFAWLAISRQQVWIRPRPWVTLLVAALFFAADLAAWHRSIVFVGPGLATLLANFQVFVLALVGVVVFAEPARLSLWLAIPLAMIGLALLIGVQWTSLPALQQEGVLWGLATALFYSGYILSLRRARQLSPGVGAANDLAIVSAASAILLAVLALASGESLEIPDLANLGTLVAYGVVGQVLGWLLISSGLERVPAGLVGLILLLQPTLAFLWDIALFGLPMSAYQGLGAGLAIAAIYAATRR